MCAVMLLTTSLTRRADKTLELAAKRCLKDRDGIEMDSLENYSDDSDRVIRVFVKSF